VLWCILLLTNCIAHKKVQLKVIKISCQKLKDNVFAKLTDFDPFSRPSLGLEKTSVNPIIAITVYITYFLEAYRQLLVLRRLLNLLYIELPSEAELQNTERISMKF
jgi:hypothetical protein